MLIGGFFVNEENIPVFITWCKYLSFIRYAYEAHVLLEFSDSSTFTCAIDSEYAVCDGTPGAVITGKDITEEQGIESSIGGNIAVLVSLILLFRLGGYYCLRFLHRPRKPTLVGGMKQE